jgi:hypothetical protein
MSFYLTLPSNSSMQYFPNNTLSNYITKLSNTVELNGKYVIGLLEIMYPICIALKIIIKNDKKDLSKSYLLTFNAMDNIADILNNLN